MPKEFPKMLYEGGAAQDEAGRPVHHSKTRIVNSAAEEAEAQAAGFGAMQTTDAHASAPEGEPVADADGDGHDDKDGTFVEGNQAAAKKPRKK